MSLSIEEELLTIMTEWNLGLDVLAEIPDFPIIALAYSLNSNPNTWPVNNISKLTEEFKILKASLKSPAETASIFLDNDCRSKTPTVWLDMPGNCPG